jgi:hypothetical protein
MQQRHVVIYSSSSSSGGSTVPVAAFKKQVLSVSYWFEAGVPLDPKMQVLSSVMCICAQAARFVDVLQQQHV